MNYQVIFKDENGCNITTPIMCERDKDAYLEMLSQNGFQYNVLERGEKKWQLAKVVFDMQLIPAARQAIKDKRAMKGLYTFGDPDKMATTDCVVKVECTTNEKKFAYVVGLWSATAKEIADFKEEIGYKKLGLVINKI